MNVNYFLLRQFSLTYRRLQRQATREIEKISVFLYQCRGWSENLQHPQKRRNTSSRLFRCVLRHPFWHTSKPTKNTDNSRIAASRRNIPPPGHRTRSVDDITKSFSIVRITTTTTLRMVNICSLFPKPISKYETYFALSVEIYRTMRLPMLCSV